MVKWIVGGLAALLFFAAAMFTAVAVVVAVILLAGESPEPEQTPAPEPTNVAVELFHSPPLGPEPDYYGPADCDGNNCPY